MKTVAEYMNDPRILKDPDMVGALEPIRELHAIRRNLNQTLEAVFRQYRR
jgi:exopolysaccharide biosynthesis predicted pyruvyltransferase EpsI